MDAGTAHIEFADIVKTYPSDAGGAFTALSEVSLSVGGNEFFTLLGPSGCGKTTLLRILAGFETPDSGQVLLDGRDITAMPANRRPVNTVFQSYALFPHMTILDNVGFGLRMQGRAKREWQERAEEMLDLVKLSGLSHRLPTQLSGGQQQRVALARALAPAPTVLLLDEPLSALDLKLRKGMQLEMKRIQQESHTTFIFVTHDQSEAITMSDRIAVMSHGELQQVGRPREIYERPANRFVADFIGETNFIAAKGPLRATGGREGYDTDLGFLATGGGNVWSPVLAIRPERIEVLAAGEAAENVLRCRIERVVFAGPTADLYLLCQDVPLRAELSISNAGLAGLAEGGEVSVRLPAEHLRALAP